MSRRIIENAEEKIIEASIQIGAARKDGSLSTRDIAKVAGISEFVIFSHFQNKKNLLTACLRTVEKRFFEADLAAAKAYPSDYFAFFNALLDWCLSHPVDTQFLLTYSLLLPRVGREDEYADYMAYLVAFWGPVKPLDVVDTSGFSMQEWIAMIGYDLRYVLFDAAYLLSGKFPDNEATRKTMCSLLLHGLCPLAK
jgi:AcrR family transcriptional regulator